MFHDALELGQNLKPRENDDLREADLQIRDMLHDAAPEAFAIRTDAEGAEATGRAVRGMTELRPGEWETLDMKQKAEWLVKVHNHVAEQYGFKPYSVKAQALPPNYGGYFNAATRSIVLNEVVLKDANPNRALNVIAHESRHGYQWHAVLNSDKVPADVREKVAIWRDNFAHYKTPAVHGYKAYYNQPVEVDARAFADEIVKKAVGATANA